MIAVLTLQSLLLLGCATTDLATREESPSVRQRADAVFQTRLQTHEHDAAQLWPVPRRRGMAGDPSVFPIEQSDRHTWHQTNDPALIATGCGDLRKGRINCERVADTAARGFDRVWERSGHPLAQDLEVVREELANELLQNVRITERHVDQAASFFSSTTMMPKVRRSESSYVQAEEADQPCGG